jgi:Papain-like cysteine protease AvrRpt2
MKNRLLCSIAALASITTFTAPALAGNEKILSVPLYSQQTNMWCWAASGEMVMKYVSPTIKVTQCDEAAVNFKKTSCCNNPTPVECIEGGWQIFNHYGFDFTQVNSKALSWNELKSSIDSNKPVMYAWAWHGGGGHMMVATGWATFNNQNFVHINNPWPPGQGDQELISYAEWVGGSNYNHDHWADFYNIRLHKKPVKLSTHIMPNVLQAVLTQPTVEVLPIKPQLLHPAIGKRAKLSLQTLRTLTPANLARIGLNTSEANSAVLGKPIQEYTVSLDKLKTFANGQVPKQLFTNPNTVLYPLISNRSVRSSVRVRKVGEEAQTASIGNANLVKMISSLEGVDLNTTSGSNESISAVQVPALGLYLIARQEGNVMKLTSPFDVPSLGLVRGQYEPAADIFARIGKTIAKDSLAPM